MAIKVRSNNNWIIPNTYIRVGGAWVLANNYVRSLADWGNELVIYIITTTTNVNLKSLFEAIYPGSWALTVPKRVVINSGVIVGATGTSNYALNIPSGFGGTVKVDNNGSIQGGGAVGSGVQGGNAIFAGAAGITINNLGTIYAGGGSGGTGGTGGYSALIASSDIVTGGDEAISIDRYSDLTITVAGANGGNGGADGAYFGGTGASGQSGEFRLKYTSGYLYISCGAKGSNGSSNVTSSTSGGAGGTGSPKGGNGGSAGTTGTSGAGGGGGAATVVKYGTSLSNFGRSSLIIAGGGGGGGGGSYGHVGKTGYNPPYPWFYSGQVYSGTGISGARTFSLGTISGGTGTQGGIAAIPTQEPQYVNQKNGGGAGGGGGGGSFTPTTYASPSWGGPYGGRDVGTYNPYWDTAPGQAELIPAFGGHNGASVYDSFKVDILSSVGFNDGITANGNGYVLLKYKTSYPGGVGGNGGRGQGYNQSAAGGAGGFDGGTNAGKGGTGGTGGAFGESGGNGFVGANGTGSTAPVLGSYFGPGYGGLAGYYIVNNANVTWTATGTRLGRVG